MVKLLRVVFYSAFNRNVIYGIIDVFYFKSCIYSYIYSQLLVKMKNDLKLDFSVQSNKPSRQRRILFEGILDDIGHVLFFIFIKRC